MKKIIEKYISILLNSIIFTIKSGELKVIMVFILLITIMPGCKQKGATVWVASPWQRVLRSTPPGELNKVKLQAAANEYEPFRLIIHSGKRQLKDVNVSVSSLKSDDEEISASNIQLFRAHYLHVTKPSRRTKNPVDWYPDALIPFIDPNAASTKPLLKQKGNPWKRSKNPWSGPPKACPAGRQGG